MNAVGGTIVGLCAALRQRIAEATSTLRLETEHKKHEPKAPAIINGYLPPKRSNNEPENPFIIVRPKEGKRKADGYRRAIVRIIIGTYSEAYDAHENCLIVWERIEKSLLEKPILNKQYVLDSALAWELYDDQPYPFWQLVGIAEFIVPTPVNLLDEEL